jgi:L-ascorbate 6-phosphate lactonase
MAFYITWLGQGGFLLTDGSTTLLLDPYLSDMVERLDNVKRLVQAPFRASDIQGKVKPDLYVITHDHIDHLDVDALTVMNKTGIRFAAPSSCIPKLVELGISNEDITPFNRGDVLTAGGFTLQAVYAKHTSDSIGVVIASGGLHAYFTGDSELDAQVGAGITCDVLFACINGRWGNMGISDALQLADRVQARLAIPHHYGMFAENTADPAPFLSGIRAQGREAFQMTHGEPFDLTTLL